MGTTQKGGTLDALYSALERITETCLTRRARRKRLHKERQSKKHWAVDWLEAFIWAAGVVLLVNQYALQAYQIPSGSMINTLEVGDHIFVNKLIYGPELLPGIAKLPGLARPARNDVIIFDNPAYIPNGPVFDITQRILYMLTLSIVDIDRDENGKPKAHFLIKRAAGTAGDHFVNYNGDMRVKFAGETRYVDENEYNKQRGWNHRITRAIKPDEYPQLKAAAAVDAYSFLGVEAPAAAASAAAQSRQPRYINEITYNTTWLAALRGVFPYDSRYSALYTRRTAGWYVPEGRILPMGDNRDNSHDGRYFGPVKESKVLGRGLLKYLPLRRVGMIR
jgi:signal peptidase I